MPAGTAAATGMRISLHNDPPVTPEEPLRNISVAATRVAPSGRVLGPEQLLTVEQAIRAQTIDAAWQLFADDVIGSLEVGKYADMVVLSADPRAVPPEQIADLEVRATFLAAGRFTRKAIDCRHRHGRLDTCPTWLILGSSTNALPIGRKPNPMSRQSSISTGRGRGRSGPIASAASPER